MPGSSVVALMLALAAQSSGAAMHVGAGAIVGAAGYLIGSELGSEMSRFAVGAVLGLGAAAGKELADIWIGEPSAIDFAWSASGAVIGLLVAWVIDRWWSEPEPSLWQTLDSRLSTLDCEARELAP